MKATVGVKQKAPPIGGAFAILKSYASAVSSASLL